ncbi:hypothetical protein BWQ96_05002 [Gracilariopsis chorda]|uniref:Uncharacterized protein n=1 Tax=Gracilariopsis chorda TaxID=448386 RepID=A0A2V3ISY8_9FLOR|nr:hypothetical protein BWQ96_05002 [Gracilariopsis chorda]|eukprot:PXF45236.1 hypothetical protein BWQ96_05002 [Gracilariopsis chorda]
MALRALKARELGEPLSNKVTLRIELKCLAHLRMQNKWTTRFVPITPATRDYIVQVSPSQDGALLAVASSNGRIEIHEPEDSDSMRLSLFSSAWSRIAACTFSRSPHDTILVAHENGNVHLYDLNTCENSTATRAFKQEAAKRHVSDILSLDKNVFAVARDDFVFLYDSRLRSSAACTAQTRVGKDAAFVGEDLELYVASQGVISLYDRRRLRAPSKLISMERKESPCVLRREISESGRLNMLRMLPGAPQGHLFYHAVNGTTGHVDILGSGQEHIKVSRQVERPPLPAPNPDDPGLQEYGTLEQSFSLQIYGTQEQSLEPSWYVRRRLGDVVRAAHGSGWIAIFPHLYKPAFEVVLFGHGSAMQSFEREMDYQASCMQTVGGTLRRIVVGGIDNQVDTLAVDTSRRPKQIRCLTSSSRWAQRWRAT